ncbi:MAG: TonB-dependent receptor [Acidobacteriaceae bacterium]|nr:TonB-dependent receptor [Acidobacteriaceae bacterium]
MPTRQTKPRLERTCSSFPFSASSEFTGWTIANVPTIDERNGDFSRSANPPVSPLNGQPFPGNQIPKSYQSPVGAAIAALYPIPNRTVAGQNFISSPVQTDQQDQFDLRIDHSLSRRSDLSARYSFSDRALYEPFVSTSDSQLPGYGVNLPRRAQNAMLSETHFFTSSLINEMRSGLVRVALNLIQQGVATNTNARVGLPVISSNPRDNGLSFITLPGFSPIGDDATLPQRGIANTYEYLDHLTWNRGRRLLRFGLDFRILQQNAYRDAEARGFLSFSGLLVGNSLAELLLGYPTTTGVARLDNAEHIRARSYAGFAQEDFRVRPDLTLTLGLHYEYNTPPADAQDRAVLFDPSIQKLVRVGTNEVPRGGFYPDRKDFAPRIGVSWSADGTGKTVLRSAYGIYYDQPSLAPGEGLYFSPPYFDLHVFFPVPRLYTLTLANPFPDDFPLGLPLAATSFQRDMRTPYI